MLRKGKSTKEPPSLGPWSASLSPRVSCLTAIPTAVCSPCMGSDHLTDRKGSTPPTHTLNSSSLTVTIQLTLREEMLRQTEVVIHTSSSGMTLVAVQKPILIPRIGSSTISKHTRHRWTSTAPTVTSYNIIPQVYGSTEVLPGTPPSPPRPTASLELLQLSANSDLRR